MTTLIRVQDKYNANKVWRVKYTDCRHYYIAQEVDGVRTKWQRETLKFIESVVAQHIITGHSVADVIKELKNVNQLAAAKVYLEVVKEDLPTKISFYMDILEYTRLEALKALKRGAAAFIALAKQGYTNKQIIELEAL